MVKRQETVIGGLIYRTKGGAAFYHLRRGCLSWAAVDERGRFIATGLKRREDAMDAIRHHANAVPSNSA